MTVRGVLKAPTAVSKGQMLVLSVYQEILLVPIAQSRASLALVVTSSLAPVAPVAVGVRWVRAQTRQILQVLFAA